MHFSRQTNEGGLNPQPPLRTPLIVQQSESGSNEETTNKRHIEEFGDVFETQPPMKGEQFKIVLQENVTPCCVTKARKIPIAYKKTLQDELDDLLNEGIISPVTQPTEWVSPIVVEQKKNKQFNEKKKTVGKNSI